MSISQAVDYALRNNGELKAFREEKGIREAAREKAGLQINPTLDFEAGTGALTGSSDENSVAVGVSQEFQLSGKREKRTRVADQELQIHRWQLADRERVLRSDVIAAAYDAILAEKKVELVDRAVEANRQLYEVTKERVAAGDIPELEMDLARVELARSEAARIDAANVLNQRRSRVSTVVGSSQAELPVVSGTLDAALPFSNLSGATSAQVHPIPLPSSPLKGEGRTDGTSSLVRSETALADLKRLAEARRPDLKALEAEKERGDAEITLAKAEGIPNLTAGVVFRRDATSMEIGGVEGKDTAYTIGVRLSMPIPVFDRNRTGVQEASARRNSSETRLAAARKNVEREVEASHATYVNSDKIVALYKGSVLPQLEENLKLTQEAYRIGEVGILSVIQEQKKFFEVSEAYLTALHDRQTALAMLEAAVGTEITGGAQ